MNPADDDTLTQEIFDAEASRCQVKVDNPYRGFEPWRAAHLGGEPPARTGVDYPPVGTDRMAPFFAYHGGKNALCINGELVGGQQGQFMPCDIAGLKEVWVFNERELIRGLPRLDPPQLALNGASPPGSAQEIAAALRNSRKRR